MTSSVAYNVAYITYITSFQQNVEDHLWQHMASFTRLGTLSSYCTPRPGGDVEGTSDWPSGNQTWLPGKFPMNRGFTSSVYVYIYIYYVYIYMYICIYIYIMYIYIYTLCVYIYIINWWCSIPTFDYQRVDSITLPSYQENRDEPRFNGVECLPDKHHLCTACWPAFSMMLPFFMRNVFQIFWNPRRTRVKVGYCLWVVFHCSSLFTNHSGESINSINYRFLPWGN